MMAAVAAGMAAAAQYATQNLRAQNPPAQTHVAPKPPTPPPAGQWRWSPAPQMPPPPPPHQAPPPKEVVLEKAVLVEPEEEPEAQAAIPPLAPLTVSPRPSAGRRRPVAPRERPGRPYPALGTPRLSLPPNAIEVSQWPQLPTKELQSHFDGDGRQWTTVPYQCWMCWQKCGHAFKARRHNCLASSLTYTFPYCPFSSVVKNPSGHRGKCEGDGVTAYLPDGPHATLRRHWAGINNGEVQPSRESSMSPTARKLSEGINALLSFPERLNDIGGSRAATPD